MKRHQSASIEMITGLRPGRILDAGSGGEAIGRALMERGFSVFPIDLFEKPFLKDTFVRADMNRPLPFAANVFDYVLCSETLQYLDNHALVFSEFERVLKKNGQVILSMPNVLSANSRIYFFQRGWFPHFKPFRTVDENKGWDVAIYNPISLVEIIAYMKKNGFEMMALKASRLKAANVPLYLVLKALYAAGLLFERNAEKAALLRAISSKDALLGDHLIMRFARPSPRPPIG